MDRLTPEQFRKILIKAMCDSGELIGNELDNGWIDWHDDKDKAGVTFTLKSDQEFFITIE